MSDNEMRLENWYIVGNAAFGNVYGNPLFDDGEFVRTSAVKSVEGDTLTTRNSIYKLGKEESKS